MVTQRPHCGSHRVVAQKSRHSAQQSYRLHYLACDYQAMAVTSQRCHTTGMMYSHSRTESSLQGFKSTSHSSSSSLARIHNPHN
jgi:hypothetical protein